MKELSIQNKIDVLHLHIDAMPEHAEIPPIHRFTPGMYIREVHVPADTLLITHIHKTEHPYVVSMGRAMVFTENGGTVLVEAPFTGITLPGTRRVAYVATPMIWTTFHATDLTDISELEKVLFEERDPKLELQKVGYLEDKK